jgi:hypothetical protein
VDPRAIQPGDTGIWATCAMNKEAKTVSDLRDLFQEVGNICLHYVHVSCSRE